MDSTRRAIIAGQFGPDADDLLRAAGFAPVGRARDAAGALALQERVQADLLLADAVLPGMDGPALAEALLRRPLWVRPALVLATPPGLRCPGGEELRSLRAAVVEKPLRAGAIEEACRRIASWPPALPPERVARLEGALDAMGVPRHPGRRALELSAALVWQDGRRLENVGRRLYPEVARLAGLSPAQAARSMGYAIDAAWRTGAIEAQHRIFGETVDARRGRPTCCEMIARLADILRWEGLP